MAGHRPLVTAVKDTAGFVSQLSIAVTVAGSGTLARHWTLVAAGTPTSTGGMVSRTVINWLLVEVLLQKSRATHVRVMRVGQVPLVAAVRVTAGLVSQLSVAVTMAGGGTLARHWTLV